MLLNDIIVNRVAQNDPTLTSLSLSGERFLNDTIRKFASALLENHTLTSVDLSHTDLNDSQGAILLKALIRHPKLTSLNLKDNRLNETAGMAIQDLLNVTQTLSFLYLSGNDFGYTSACAIAAGLKENRTVTFVDLSMNGLGESDIHALIEMLKVNSTIHSLNLRGNYLSNKNLSNLEEALKINRTLTFLGFRGDDNLGDRRVLGIAEALKLNKNRLKVQWTCAAPVMAFAMANTHAAHSLKYSILPSIPVISALTGHDDTSRLTFHERAQLLTHVTNFTHTTFFRQSGSGAAHHVCASQLPEAKHEDLSPSQNQQGM